MLLGMSASSRSPQYLEEQQRKVRLHSGVAVMLWMLALLTSTLFFFRYLGRFWRLKQKSPFSLVELRSGVKLPVVERRPDQSTDKQHEGVKPRQDSWQLNRPRVKVFHHYRQLLAFHCTKPLKAQENCEHKFLATCSPESITKVGCFRSRWGSWNVLRFRFDSILLLSINFDALCQISVQAAVKTRTL